MQLTLGMYLSANKMLAEEGLLLLGDDFLPWIVLALGSAMVAGNLLALIRPPRPDTASPNTASPDTASPDTASPSRPPVGRAVVMIAIGAVASIWGLASLLN
jgi:Na+/proline symporter